MYDMSMKERKRKRKVKSHKKEVEGRTLNQLYYISVPNKVCTYVSYVVILGTGWMIHNWLSTVCTCMYIQTQQTKLTLCTVLYSTYIQASLHMYIYLYIHTHIYTNSNAQGNLCTKLQLISRLLFFFWFLPAPAPAPSPGLQPSPLYWLGKTKTRQLSKRRRREKKTPSPPIFFFFFKSVRPK